jgi:hypothetical protein
MHASREYGTHVGTTYPTAMFSVVRYSRRSTVCLLSGLGYHPLVGLPDIVSDGKDTCSEMAQDEEQELSGPDLAAGVPLADIADGGMLLGHADGEAVLLARQGEEVFAVSAHCTHYHGPLAEGLLVGDTVRFPCS